MLGDIWAALPTMVQNGVVGGGILLIIVGLVKFRRSDADEKAEQDFAHATGGNTH